MTSRRSTASLARSFSNLVQKQIALTEPLEGRTLFSIANPSFESMDLSGWETVEGSDIMAEVVGQFGGKTAFAGEQFAKISAHDWSGLRQTFTAAAGETLSGWAFFHSRNGRFAQDEARVEIRRGDEVVARPYFMNSEMLGRDDSTPWTAWSYTFTEVGTYTIRAISESGTICPAAVTLGLDALEISSPPAVVTQSDAYTVDADQLVVAAPGVLSNDDARDGGPLSMQLVTGPEHGTLTFNADGSFTYVPDSGYDGLDSFVYAARDQAGNLDEATVTLIIPDRPQPPTPEVTALRYVPLDPREGQNVRLEGAVGDPRGIPQFLTIDWGDGTSQELDLGLREDFSAFHVYEDPGRYTITVTPRNGTTTGTPESALVLVADVPPSLSISGPRDAATGGTYMLELRGREGQDEQITSWRIDWGDGTVQTLDGNPTTARHAYASSGNYRVQAWATVDGRLTPAPYSATRLDREFADDGIIVKDFGQSETITEVLRGSEDRIVILGTQIGGAVILERYLADGTLDATFGDAGTVIWNRYSAAGTDAVIQDDGRILVAASYVVENRFVRVLLRFNTDGSLDESFGEGGELATDATAVALSDGRIVTASVGSFQRYTVDGALDTTFGTNGTTAVDLGRVREVVVQSDGSILATGQRPGRQGLYVVRLNEDGTIDEDFGTDGYAALGFNAGSYGDGDFGGSRALAVTAGGKILVGGASTLARLNPDGSLDESFGTGGTARLSGSALDIEVEEDGDILASGSFGDRNTFALFRFESSGRLDDSFGDGGVFTVDFPGVLEQANSLVTLEDGSIIAAGLARPGQFDFAIAKLIIDEGAELVVTVS